MLACLVSAIGRRFLPHVPLLVAILFLTAATGVVAAPILYALVTGKVAVLSAGTDPAAWSRAAVLELSYACAWSAGFLWCRGNRADRCTIAGRVLTKRKAEPMLWLLLAVGVIGHAAAAYRLRLEYGSLVSLAKEADVRPGEASLASGLGAAASFLVPSLLVLVSNTRQSIIRILLLCLLGLVLVNGFLGGARAQWLVPCITAAFWLAWQTRRLRSLLFTLGFAGLLLLGTSAAVQEYRSTKLVGDGSGRRTQQLRSFWLALGDVGIGDNVEAWLLRLDLVQAGSFLIEDAEASGFVGWRPYRGLLFAYIPRVLYPSKPAVGSATGEVQGKPQFLVAAARGQPWNSNSCTVSSVLYWQFGRWGVFCGGLLAGLVMHFLVRELASAGLLGHMLLLHFCGATLLFYTDILGTVRWVQLTLVPILVLLALVPASGSGRAPGCENRGVSVYQQDSCNRAAETRPQADVERCRGRGARHRVQGDKSRS